MEEFDNLSIKSFSTLSTLDSFDKISIDKEFTDKESTNIKSINRELNDNNDKQISLDRNQQSNSIDLNYVNDESNRSADLKNEKIKLIDNSLNEDKCILKLDWYFIEELIELLGEYTRLLVSNKEISIDEKKLIKKNKNDLIKLLNGSPSKFYSIRLNLDSNFKDQIIEQLIKNENLICYENKIDTNLEYKLIEENNNLIIKLINLPIQYSNKEVNLFDEEESKFSQSEDKKLVNKLETENSNLQNETIELKKEISELKRKLDDEKNQLNDHRIFLKEINKLKSKLDDEIFKNTKLRNQLNQTNSIKLYYLQEDMEEFFKYRISKNYNEKVLFRNIKWYIDIRLNYDLDENRKYLGFFLQAENEIDDMYNVNWECTVTYELILKNHLWDNEDKIMKFNNSSFSKSKKGAGKLKFISEEELFNLENGYMQDDSINLEINLIVHKMERNI